MNTPYQHTIVGMLIGLSFLVFAWFIDIHEIAFTWVGIVAIHKSNFIHYVVDSAPIVLGLLGKFNHKKSNNNKGLRKINKSLYVLTYKITHDLRGLALNIKGLVSVIKTIFPKGKKEDKNGFIAKLDSSINLWLDTFAKFMELLRQEKAGLKTKSICELRDIIDSSDNELNLELSEKKGMVTTNFEDCQTVFAPSDDLSSIFKNLLSNSMILPKSHSKITALAWV